jgi:hypothetical protein
VYLEAHDWLERKNRVAGKQHPDIGHRHVRHNDRELIVVVATHFTNPIFALVS